MCVLKARVLSRELAMRRGRASTFDMARALTNQSKVAPREWPGCTFLVLATFAPILLDSSISTPDLAA
jgi:hypothetical protein